MGALLTLLLAVGPQPLSDSLIRTLLPRPQARDVVLVQLDLTEAMQAEEAGNWAEGRGAAGVGSLLPLEDLPWPGFDGEEDLLGSMGLSRDWDGRIRRWEPGSPATSFPARVLAAMGDPIRGPRQLGNTPPLAMLSLDQFKDLPDGSLNGKFVLLAPKWAGPSLWTLEGPKSSGEVVGGLLAGGHHPRLPRALLALLGAALAVLGALWGRLHLVPLCLALCALSTRLGLPLPAEAFLLTSLLSVFALRQARRRQESANLAQLTLAFESAPLGPPASLTDCAEQLCHGAVHIHGVLAAWVLAPGPEGWEELARRGDGSALDPAICERLLGRATPLPEDSAYGAQALRVKTDLCALLVYQFPDLPGFDPKRSLSLAVEACARRLALADSRETPLLARRLHALLDREAIFRASFRQAPVASILYDTLGHCLEAPTDLPAAIGSLRLNWERLEEAWIGLGGQASDLPLAAGGGHLRQEVSPAFWAQLEAICAGGRLLALRLSLGRGSAAVGNGADLPNSPGHDDPESHRMYSPS